MVKPGARPGRNRRLSSAHHFPLRSRAMNMQKIFEKSENSAVAYAVAIFVAFHFGMLFLFGLV
jgi:hypothetical protein